MKGYDLGHLDEIGKKILRSAYRDPHDWRTLGAIAREAGFSPQDVQEYIRAHHELFREPSFAPRGTEVYGLQPDVADYLDSVSESDGR